MISPDRVMVIGAGLAGAAVCAALARRGVHCTLIDAAPGPAQAASALPVGMLSPHVTRAPTPLSRLCDLGVAHSRAELLRLLPQGPGWTDTEVDNRGHDPGRWPATLVRPSALAQAWLDEAHSRKALTSLWNCTVQALRPAAHGLWHALDREGNTLATAPSVVVAAAFGSLALLASGPPGLDTDALPLRPVKGQMSFGAQRGEPLAPRAQRENGVFVPLYEDAGLAPALPTRIWAMGSTYERGADNTEVHAAAHERNAQSLQTISPAAAQQLRDALKNGDLLGWAQVRCASLDRLPLMGAVPDLAALQLLMAQAGGRRGRVPLVQTPRWPGLFMLSALGSRGLTLAGWCAERLAEQMLGLPVPLHTDQHDLLRALDPARFAWKRARRQ